METARLLPRQVLKSVQKLVARVRPARAARRCLSLISRPVLGRRRSRFQSLKSRLTLGAALIALGVLLLVYLTLLRTAQGVASTEARKRTEEVVRYFSATIAEALAAGDRLQIQLLASAFQKNGVYSILVTNRAGERLYDARPDCNEYTLYNSPVLRPLSSGGILGTTSLRGKEYLHAARVISFGGSPVGMIHLWLDKSDLEESIRGANTPIFLIFALGVGALLLLGYVSLHTPFRALKRLGAAVKKIEAGDLSVRVPVHGADEVAQFCAAFNAMVDGLVKAHREATEKQLETIRAMINTVEAKDSYTAGHCLRVGGYAKEIVDRCAILSTQETFVVQTAALLHDIGKLGIPDKVLLKDAGLTPEEMTVIRSHVTVGEEILSHMDSMRDVARAIRHHHERWDGFGYPDGLRGEAIPFASRVVAVADTIDAILTDRPYRKAMSMEAAIQVLKEGKGKQFDPAVIDLAVAMLEKKTHEAPRAPGVDVVADSERELQPA